MFFDVAITQHDRLSDFTFDNLTIVAKNEGFSKGVVDGFTFSTVRVNGKVVR